MYSVVIAAGLNYGFTLCNLNDFVLLAYSRSTPSPLEVGIPPFRPGSEDPTQKSILSSLTSAVLVGSIAGSMAVTRVAEKRGNRWTCLAFGLVGMLTNILQALPINWIYLLITRVLVGISTSALTTVAPAFVSERAESSRRGAMIISFQMATCFGQVLAYVLTVILDVAVVPELWFLLDAAPWACNFVISIAAIYLGGVEARKVDTASEAGGIEDNSSGVVQAKADEDEGTASSPESASAGLVRADAAAVGEQTSLPGQEGAEQNFVTWNDLFCRKTYRKSLLLAIVMPFQQQAEGINTCMMYATRVFSSLNIPHADTVGAVFVSLWNFISTCVSAPLVDCLGRRKLLFIGNGFAFSGLVLFAVSYAFIVPHYPSESIQIACIAVSALLFIFGFEIGAGPLLYVVCGEALPREAKAKLGGLSFSVLWITNIVVVFTFPFFERIEWLAFTIYACCTVLTTVILFFILPETKGKSLAEIEALVKQ